MTDFLPPHHRYTSIAESDRGRWRTLPRGQAIAGATIGIICIPGVTALIPGNVQNASTFKFPVLYHVLDDVEFGEIACGDPAVTPKVIAAARALERQGARMIVGACGSLGHYQRPVANAVRSPAFMSILTQVPNVLMGLAESQKILVVFATTSAFTDLVRDQCGIGDTSRIVATGLFDNPMFRKFVEAEVELDLDLVSRSIEASVASAMTDDVGAILLQCSDLPPFAAALQRRFGLPVFDMVGLVNSLHFAALRSPFLGNL